MPLPSRLARVLHRLTGRCVCGHRRREHTTDGICCAKLSTFPDGGFHGVCPCTPGWLESEARDG